MDPNNLSLITWEAALSVSGAAAACWSVNAALQRALGDIWTDRMNRICTLIVAIAITESLAIAGGVTSWAVYMLQFINGCIVSLAVAPLKPAEKETINQVFWGGK